jgi:H2-forming N5,N10-methylenetetrahydromethanopterin dehydrogenase-like enzyme
MSVMDSLRETAGMAGPAAALANELLVIRDNYERGDLSTEEYQYLLQEIADIKSQQELASDEIACRYIVEAAKILSSAV